MEQIIKNKKYFVAPVNSSKANKFTCYYHYSHVGFKKAKLNLGIYDNHTQQLVGVMQWGCSAQEAIRLDRYVKNPIKKEEYYELNRFCMADSEERNSESQAIALGIKWIKKFHPHVRLLVSYAGRKEGNYGYIYQATNWEYLGYFVSPGFWQIDGQEMHQLTLWYHYTHSKYTELPFIDALKNMYHSVIQTWTKQFIYIQRLDKNLIPASPILKYPKEVDMLITDKIKVYKNESFEYNEKILEKPIYFYNPNEYLFTRRKLIRDGTIEKKIDMNKIQVASYDLFGHLIEIRHGIKSYEPDFSSASIRNSYNKHKSYKNRFFQFFPSDEKDIPEQINVSILAIIDEIPFVKMAEIGRYCGVSRQAVAQARQRQSKQINGYKIIWMNQEVV